jgi:hypothetical protein
VIIKNCKYAHFNIPMCTIQIKCIVQYLLKIQLMFFYNYNKKYTSGSVFQIIELYMLYIECNNWPILPTQNWISISSRRFIKFFALSCIRFSSTLPAAREAILCLPAAFLSVPILNGTCSESFLCTHQTIG